MVYTIINLNIRSLRRNFGEFSLFLENFNFLADFIALTETWASVDEMERYVIPGYLMFLVERTGQRAGGVALYVRNSFTGLFLDRSTENYSAVNYIAIDEFGKKYLS